MFDITAHVCLSFVGKDAKTHASLTSDYSLQISPVQDFDFGVWRCEQHEFSIKTVNTYKLYHGKTKYRESVSEKQKVEKDPNFTVSKSLKAISQKMLHVIPSSSFFILGELFCKVFSSNFQKHSDEN